MRGTIRKGAQWMVAWSQASMPVFTVIMRRSFGVGGNNYAAPIGAAGMARVTWPPIDAGSLPVEGGVEAAYKRQLEEAETQRGPEAREAMKQDILHRIELTSGPMRAVSGFGIEEMVYPADTRKHICEWIVLAYKKLGQVANLGPRPLGFRP
jgi:acetyl-CoA carboxylase carboxyltransferase component